MAELTDEMKGWLTGMLMQLGVPEDMIYDDPRMLVWQFKEHVQMAKEEREWYRKWRTADDYEVAFTPGQYITQSHWESAKGRLQQLGLWWILRRVGVKELRVVPNDQLPPGISPGSWTIRSGDMVIIAGDAQVFPGQVFMGRILHETFHLWQQTNPNPVTLEGVPIDPVKGELPAYTTCWFYHMLAGDGIKVFRVPSGETEAYPGAKELQ